MIMALGVKIVHKQVIEKNYCSVINHLEVAMNSWNKRGLSLMDKILIINMSMISLFILQNADSTFAPLEICK